VSGKDGCRAARRRPSSLARRQRAGEVDATYAAYDEHPLAESDEWGDLESFREAAAM
jgi:hypothetical protein